jgi:hypothetical protein
VSERPCRACGKTLRFAKSAVTGKILPLERVRVVYQCHVDADGVDEARAIALGEPRAAYISHFETCPRARREK